MVLTIVLSLFGYCSLLVTLKYCKASQSPIFVVCFISILVLFGGMLNILLPTTYITYVLGILSLFFVIFFQIKKKQFLSFLKELLTPGLVMYFLLILVFYRLCVPIVVNSVDEFSHWALYPKYMLIYNRLPLNDSIVSFFSLPPIGSIIQYYFASFFQNTESMLYWGQSIFLLATVMSSVGETSWKKAGKVILISLLTFLVLLKYNELHYFNLYSDALTAMVAFAAYAVYIHSDKEYKSLLKLIPILFVIPLIRDSAPAFAIFSLILITVDQIFLNGFKVKHKNIISTTKSNRHIIACIILLLTIVISYFVWNTYIQVSSQSVIIDRSIRTNTRNLQDSLLYASEYLGMLSYLLVGNYSGAYRIFSSTTAVYMIIIIMIMIISYGLHYKKMFMEAKRLKVLLFSVTGVLIAFIIGTLFTYLYRFSVEEADGFASFSRYYGSIVIFIMLVTIAYIYNLKNRIVNQNIKRGLTYMLVFLMLLMIVSTSTRRLDIRRSRIVSVRGIRYDVQDRVKDFIGMFDENDKVYIIYQGKQEALITLTSRYILMVDVNKKNFNLNSENIIAKEDLAEELVSNGYNYFLVVEPDDYLWNTYGTLFDETNHQLYKVNNDSTPLLKYIE